MGKYNQFMADALHITLKCYSSTICANAITYLSPWETPTLNLAPKV